MSAVPGGGEEVRERRTRRARKGCCPSGILSTTLAGCLTPATGVPSQRGNSLIPVPRPGPTCTLCSSHLQPGGPAPAYGAPPASLIPLILKWVAAETSGRYNPHRKGLSWASHSSVPLNILRQSLGSTPVVVSCLDWPDPALCPQLCRYDLM